MSDPRSYQHRQDEIEVGQIMTQIEVQVETAMRDAKYVYVDDDREWVPFTILFTAYHRWFRLLDLPGKPLANRREFGRILNIIFPDSYIVKRRVDGIKFMGRSRLTGPRALRSTFGEV